MIVKDSKNDAAPTNLKSSYAPVSARGSGESSYNNAHYMGRSPPPAPPPAYDGVQNPFPGYRVNEPAGRRFWRALAVALIIWVFLTLLARNIFELHLVHRHHKHGGLSRDYPEFDSGEAFQCIERPDWPSTNNVFYRQEVQEMLSNEALPPYHSSTSFSLPANADLLYFLSRGSLAYGSVQINIAPEPSSDEATVEVDVGIWYWSPEALDRASVCALERHENGDYYGVGIFTPRSWPGRPRRDRLYFEVVIHLPLGIYKALEMDYENFSLRAADLQGSVSFEKIHLKTSNGPVHADSLEAFKSTVKSSNGPISGRYNVTKSLELVTSNAGIDTSIDMYSENSNITSLLLKTSNGHIRGDLSLQGPPVSSAFDVQARSSNAPVVISISTQPHTSPLTLGVHTSNSPARVALHPAFEGPFTLRTSAFTPPLLRTGTGEVEDPSGEGRRRVVEVSRQARGALDGKVWWGEWTSRGKGWAHITTSNSPVELDLTGSPSW